MPSVRIAVVVLLAAIEVAAAGLSIATYDIPIGTYGFLLARDVTFAEVDPESLTARAGVARGDRLIYETLPLRGRRYAMLNEEVPGGAVIRFAIVHRGKTTWVTVPATPLWAIGKVETLTYAVAGLALGLVGLALVLLRPSRMTWAFALIAPALLLPFELIFWAQETQGVAATLADLGFALLYATQPAAMMIFASRFPNDRPTGIARWIDRIGTPAGIAIAVLYVYAYLKVRYSHLPPVHFPSLYDLSVLVPAVLALVALISTYVTARGEARARLAPVILSFVFLLITDVVQQFAAGITTNNTVLFAVALAFSLSPAAVAAAVAYGIVRHRVMEVSFIVSRTLVYSILTIGAVAIFAMIEYVFGRVLEHQGVATLLNILAAVGLGVSFNLVHSRVDGWIDRLLFRRRYLAQERLTATGRALAQATTSAPIDAALVDEAGDALDLASAALFRREPGAYRRAGARGWESGEAIKLEENDPLVLRMRADLAALDPHDVPWTRTDIPGGERRAIYAVPVVVGHRLEAIGLYGAHSTGEDLDPDERRMLRRLATAAAAAYDQLTIADLRNRLHDLETENEALRKVESKLSTLLGERLS